MTTKIERVRDRWRDAQHKSHTAATAPRRAAYRRLAAARLALLIKLKKADGKYFMPSHWQTSKAGLLLIRSFEGYYSRPYNDPVGHATIGYGHLLHYGPVTAADRKQWGAISKRQAIDLLKEDLKEYEGYVKDFVNVRLTQHQFDALVSFVYNVGPGGLKGQVGYRLNNQQYHTAAVRLLDWDKAGNPPVPLAGLTRRRKAERKLFLS